MLHAGASPGEMAEAAARLTGWLLVPLGLYILVSALDDLVIDLLWLLRLACGKLSRRKAPSACAAQPERPSPSSFPAGARPKSSLRCSTTTWPRCATRCTASSSASIPTTRPPSPPSARRRRATPNCAWCACRTTVHVEGRLPELDLPRDRGRRAEHGPGFRLLVLHDAEDLIHPDELGLFNARLDEAHFLQLPVLALPDAALGADPRRLLRRLRRKPVQGPPHAATGRRLRPGLRRRDPLRRDALRHLAASYGEVFDPQLPHRGLRSRIARLQAGPGPDFPPAIVSTAAGRSPRASTSAPLAPGRAPALALDCRQLPAGLGAPRLARLLATDLVSVARPQRPVGCPLSLFAICCLPPARSPGCCISCWAGPG